MIALDSAPAAVSIITQFFFPIQNSLIDCFVACCPLEHCLDPKRKRLKECWRCLCPAQRQFQRFTSKTVKSEFGEFQLDIPRDRNGEFEPEIVPKYCRDISGIEEKVISLYARGMTTRDIGAEIQELYGINVSAEKVSKITDRILPEIKEWQSRPLEPVYPFVFMDAIHYKIREDGRILNRAAYVVLGVTLEGNKDILSITIGANESSKFWLGMLNDLKNRGV